MAEFEQDHEDDLDSEPPAKRTKFTVPSLSQIKRHDKISSRSGPSLFKSAHQEEHTTDTSTIKYN